MSGFFSRFLLVYYANPSAEPSCRLQSQDVRKGGVEFKGGSLHDGFGGFDGFGGSGEHLAIRLLVLQNTGQRGSCEGFDGVGGFGGSVMMATPASAWSVLGWQKCAELIFPDCVMLVWGSNEQLQQQVFFPLQAQSHRHLVFFNRVDSNRNFWTFESQSCLTRFIFCRGKLCHLQLEFFCLQLSFFAYSPLRCFLDTLSHCKQRISTVSKKLEL